MAEQKAIQNPVLAQLMQGHHHHRDLNPKKTIRIIPIP
jgi:hypothetical protein